MKASKLFLVTLMYAFVAVAIGFLSSFNTKRVSETHASTSSVLLATKAPQSSMDRLKNMWARTKELFIISDVEKEDEKIVFPEHLSEPSKSHEEEGPLIAAEVPEETTILDRKDYLMSKLKNKEVISHHMLKRLCRSENERKCLCCSFYAESDAHLIWHIYYNKHHYGQETMQKERYQFIFRLRRRFAKEGLAFTAQRNNKPITWTNVLQVVDHMTDAELRSSIELHVMGNHLIKMNLEDEDEDDDEIEADINVVEEDELEYLTSL